MREPSYKIINESELRNMLKEIVKEVIEEEMIKIRLMLVSYVSDEEQKEIKEVYKEPLGRKREEIQLLLRYRFSI